MKLIRLSNVSKIFRNGNTERCVLSGVELEIAPGEVVAIMGANGVGKSTLGNIVAGVDSDFDGERLLAPGMAPQSPMIFQDFRASLLPWLSVEANIGFPLALQGIGRAERRRRVADMLARAPVRLQPGTPVGKLSGGQAQLVCILRALLVSPRMILCDEPFSAIDVTAHLMLRQLMAESSRAAGMSLVLISHNVEDSLYLADRILILAGAPARFTKEIAVSRDGDRGADWLDRDYAVGLRRQLRDALTT